MATQVKTFEANIEDKDGWGFGDAFVAIHTASETSQNTFESQEWNGDYLEGMTSHVIAYKANFWKDKETQIQGKPSRSLFAKSFIDPVEVCEKDEDGEDKKDTNGNLILTGKVIPGYWAHDEIFYVDLEHSEAKQIKGSGLSKNDTIFKLIEFDLKRRVKK